MTNGFKGLATLANLNGDRVLFTLALVAALYAGSFVALV